MNVEHENFFVSIFASVQLAAKVVRHEVRHRVREVGVHHQGVGAVLAARGSHADGLSAVEQRLSFTSSPERELHAPFRRATRAIASLTAEQPP